MFPSYPEGSGEEEQEKPVMVDMLVRGGGK